MTAPGAAVPHLSPAWQPDAAFWRGRRVFLTGHTGFKGSWLALWLTELDAEVHGYALPPEADAPLHEHLHGRGGLASSTLADLRDAAALRAAMDAARPEVLLHLGAQPLVRRSYAEPVYTFDVNVLGTARVLDAARHQPDLRAVLVITTDKVYENREWAWGYRESDPLGGHDPYSSSKAAAEVVTASMRASFFGPGGHPARVASARAGNVIGGGDAATDRLVPDLLRAFARGEAARIRSPGARRPWQHVLEPLAGYLQLAELLAQGDDRARDAWARAWNFGPLAADTVPVGELADRLCALWGQGASWVGDRGEHPHEAGLLALDIALARSRLGWRPRWRLDQALSAIVDWARAEARGDDLRALSVAQIHHFLRSPALD